MPVRTMKTWTTAHFLALALGLGLPLGNAQNYQAQQLGCVSSDPTSFTPLSTGLHYPETAQTNDCANVCFNYRYMYTKPVKTSTGDALDCYCEGPLDGDPSTGDPLYISKDSYSTGLLSNNPYNLWVCPDNTYTAYILHTTFVFQGCYSYKNLPAVTPASASQPTSVGGTALLFPFESDVNAVLKDCAYTTYLELLFNPSGYTAVCGNAVSYNGGTPAPCDLSVFHIYTHDPNEATYGYTRRKMSRGTRKNDFCPMGLTACYTHQGASKDEYECLDTANELESCGGCMYGSPSSLHDKVKGIDCTAMYGVLNTAVTCSKGSCQVSACERGFLLKNGQCVQSYSKRRADI